MDRLLLAGVLLLAAAMFVTATRHMTQSVYQDEVEVFRYASAPTLPDVFWKTIAERPYPPLYFFAVHYWLRVQNGEAGLRMPAAVFGALAIVAVFILGRELAGNVVGAVAAVFFALAPGVFVYSVNASAYTLLMLASALSTVFLFRAARSGGWGAWLGYAAFALIGLGTHTLFMFVLAGQGLAGLYLKRSRRFFFVMGLLAVVALAWSLFYLHYGGDVRAPMVGRFPPLALILTTAGMYLGALSRGSILQLALWCLLQAAGGTLFFLRDRRTLWALAIFAAVALVSTTLFVAVTLQFIAYRYALGVFPVACVIAAYAFTRLKRAFARLAIGALAIGYAAAGVAFIATSTDQTFEWQDWRSIARTLEGRAASGDPIVLTRADAMNLNYYYRGKGKVIEAAPTEIEPLIERMLKPGSGYDKVWMVAAAFNNPNPMVARFTEAGRPDLSQFAARFAKRIGRHDLTIARTTLLRQAVVLLIARQPPRE